MNTGEGRGGGGNVQNIGGPRGAKLFTGCELIGAPAPNQCQIITFFTLKTANIANLRLELKSIYLEITSNKKRTYINKFINWYTCDLVLLFHIDVEEKCGWIIGGGGGRQRVCWPPPKLLGGGCPLPPPSYEKPVYIILDIVRT